MNYSKMTDEAIIDLGWNELQQERPELASMSEAELWKDIESQLDPYDPSISPLTL